MEGTNADVVNVTEQERVVVYEGPARCIDTNLNRSYATKTVLEIEELFDDGSTNSHYFCTQCDFNADNFMAVRGHLSAHTPKDKIKPRSKRQASINDELLAGLEREIERRVAREIERKVSRLKAERDAARAAQRDAEKRLSAIRKSLSL
jgi:hypothetical protein